ncbi:transient receptor potential cation channel subfamily V member 5 [Macrosteles quadrilineatus]|uniref:transient receptor potential cation channel subfamily V member 5 n=1 Tax=Macrosteles quadrilineatus TaxID=74068 RepID=UPI0023E2D4A6|nr:transient receptor potential cation channel subfamily V member 5 [Macrosteles quadrilineatus]
MGNSESNVASGVKKQADTSNVQMYKLVDLKGGGLLVELMKRAAQNKQYAELDHAIKTKVEPFLYNRGKGKWIPVAQLVLMRNIDRPRHKMLPIVRNMDEGTFDVNKNYMNIPEPKEGERVDTSKYREVCWDLNERGAVGETVLHLCLLSATSVHADLAKRLLKFYPKLINDIYMCDEYYGENVLHIAIVNEDPAMVKFLLDSGVNFEERCFGNFMCPEDQKFSRSDSVDHEWVNLTPFTNYEGYVYWGEYPLCFAACRSQEECYRLILARGANPDAQDTNGNTVLHMLVIYEKSQMFDMAYETGSNLSILNIQNLTPLTLAAKLARIEIFFHILNIEREIYWQIGSITCAAYPLSQIDTIDNETGNISKNSALNLVVFGEKDEHLELMDGVLVDLLHAKWNAFVKYRFYRQFIFFSCYFLVSLAVFTMRPGPPAAVVKAANTTSLYSSSTYTTSSPFGENGTSTTSMAEVLMAMRMDGSSNVVFNENNTLELFNNMLPTNITPILQQLNVSFSELLQSDNIGEILNSIAVPQEPPDKLSIDEETRKDNESDGKILDTLKLAAFINRVKKDTPTNISNKNVTFGNLVELPAKNGSGGIPRVDFTKINLVLPTSSTNPQIGSLERIKGLWEEIAGDCRLLQANDSTDVTRLLAELFLEIGAFLYILAALREAKFLGLNMFIENLMTAPSRVMFLISCSLMLVMPFLRFGCYEEIEDVVSVIIMLTTAPYFLFFCRGFKTVGPFVVMIYRMIMGDLLRFATIYLVFVMGFSQAYYIIFLSFDNPLTPDGVDDSVSNPLPNPMEAVMGMFFMSLTNFGDYYAAFERTEHETEAKIMFVVYMGIVAILLVNMLIAMMGNTYQKIAETRNEWQRQWARIVLVVERGVSPKERLNKLMWYSQPMSDGRRALVLRLNQTEEDKEEMKEIMEMKRIHLKNVEKRRRGRKLLDTPSPKRIDLNNDNK